MLDKKKIILDQGLVNQKEGATTKNDDIHATSG
jgi:hypothetical protein